LGPVALGAAEQKASVVQLADDESIVDARDVELGDGRGFPVADALDEPLDGGVDLLVAHRGDAVADSVGLGVRGPGSAASGLQFGFVSRVELGLGFAGACRLGSGRNFDGLSRHHGDGAAKRWRTLVVHWWFYWWFYGG